MQQKPARCCMPDSKQEGSCRQVHLGSSEAPPVLLAAWVSQVLLATSIRRERLWQVPSSLRSALCILLKTAELLSEPESSSSKSGLHLLRNEVEKERREGRRQRIGKKYN